MLRWKVIIVQSFHQAQHHHSNVSSYILANARAGFRVSNGLSAFVWGRNIFNKDYFEQLLVASGNTGQYAGVLGDPRTYGITLSYSF